MRFGRKNRRVYCAGCANFFYLGGNTRPMCVATAKYEGGPIRRKVEVTGVVSAEKRNVHNDCPYRQSVSRRAYDIKRWLLWRLNDGTRGEQVGEASVEQFPVAEEYNRKQRFLEEQSDDEGSNDEEEFFSEEESAYFGEEGEDILSDRGDGNNDERGSSREGGGEDVQDT